MDYVRKPVNIYKREECCIYYLVKALEHMIKDDDLGLSDYFVVTRMIQNLIEKGEFE